LSVDPSNTRITSAEADRGEVKMEFSTKGSLRAPLNEGIINAKYGAKGYNGIPQIYLNLLCSRMIREGKGKLIHGSKT
jgi:hypothetical protein